MFWNALRGLACVSTARLTLITLGASASRNAVSLLSAGLLGCQAAVSAPTALCTEGEECVALNVVGVCAEENCDVNAVLACPFFASVDEQPECHSVIRDFEVCLESCREDLTEEQQNHCAWAAEDQVVYAHLETDGRDKECR